MSKPRMPEWKLLQFVAQVQDEAVASFRSTGKYGGGITYTPAQHRFAKELADLIDSCQEEDHD